MPLINDYGKSWAIRYLREAKAELVAAQKNPIHGLKLNPRSYAKGSSRNLL